MENQSTPIDEDLIAMSQEKPKIYSKRAIWRFSFFFTSVFGGILLMQNLRDIGKKKEANMVLIFSIIYSIACIIIVNIPEKTQSSLTYICNIAGAAVLTEYFFKKYFPTPDDYEKKKIWKPLIISILITIPIILAMIYTLGKGE